MMIPADIDTMTDEEALTALLTVYDNDLEAAQFVLDIARGNYEGPEVD